MRDPRLVLARDRDGKAELVVNFGVFSGREATEAEIDRLGQALLEELDAVEIVAQHRYEFDREVEARVYQVCVELPPSAEGRERELMRTVEAWARECIAERRLLRP